MAPSRMQGPGAARGQVVRVKMKRVTADTVDGSEGLSMSGAVVDVVLYSTRDSAGRGSESRPAPLRDVTRYGCVRSGDDRATDGRFAK